MFVSKKRFKLLLDKQSELERRIKELEDRPSREIQAFLDLAARIMEGNDEKAD